LSDIPAEIVTIYAAIGSKAADAFKRYGKGRHPAALNMGDCFAYACAKLSGAALLYKGADFDATDLRAGS
jgi:ribonuclease VapC